jgi:cytochrome b561
MRTLKLTKEERMKKETLKVVLHGMIYVLCIFIMFWGYAQFVDPQGHSFLARIANYYVFGAMILAGFFSWFAWKLDREQNIRKMKEGHKAFVKN